jgi:hypothetical protein
LLGFIWTLWHVPAFFLVGVMGQSFSGFGWWALDTFAFTVVITWLFLRAHHQWHGCGRRVGFAAS